MPVRPISVRVNPHPETESSQVSQRGVRTTSGNVETTRAAELVAEAFAENAWAKGENVVVDKLRPSHVRSRSHPLALSSTLSSREAPSLESWEASPCAGRRVEKSERAELPKNVVESDLIRGRCQTCNSLVRWPKQLNVFRCAVCLMINDLKADQMTTQLTNRPSIPVSVGITRGIAIDCIRRHIRSQAGLSKHHSHKNGHKDAATARSAPYPPYLPSSKAERDKKVEGSNGEILERGRVFQRLEDYILNCFRGVDCLNYSFLSSKPSQQSVSPRKFSRREADKEVDLNWNSTEQDTFPDLDAKTLLIGDIAENGTWWTGRASPLQASSPKASISSSRSTRGACESSKDHGIDWSSLYQWYNTICNLYDIVLEEAKHDDYRDVQPELLQRVCAKLMQPCIDVQNILLNATELLLRRPGKPLVCAFECRFMLIIMTNPLLCSASSSQPKVAGKAYIPTMTHGSGISDSYDPGQGGKTSHWTASDRRRTCISSIVKRILGLVANASSLCQQPFVAWLSRLSHSSFRQILELIQRFVSHRLHRIASRKRRNSEDSSISDLVPSVNNHLPATAAQLHDSIVSGRHAQQRAPVSKTAYGEDWQLRAAARVVLFLFAANTSDSIRSSDKASLTVQSQVLNDVKSFGGQSIDTPQKRKVAVSTFYNSRVDLCDLVSDFEAWESRRGNFCFCQFPMLLSLQAKIKIMEYEARRQMEVKAREAFFTSILNRKAISQYLILKVRRKCLAEDSLRTISEVVGAGQEEIKKGLRIEFLGEEGLDSGGPRKEWFLLLVREVFDEDHGLFQYDEHSRHCYFNPHSFERSDQFFLVGVLLGLAIYNSTILDVALPPFAFRKLLASAPNKNGPTAHTTRPQYHCNLDDLAEFRPSLANGLRKLLDYDGNVEETFLQDFVAPMERFGQIFNVPLCSNGEHRTVTKANRQEYVSLYVQYLLDLSVQRQFEPFKRGFYTVCGGNALSLFRPEEIELLIRGSDGVLDVSALRAVAIHENWGNETDIADQGPKAWFWETFGDASPTRQRSLLRFITASDRIPATGAVSLVLRVSCLGNDINRYPIARTCFNMIGLYNYRSKHELEQKLWGAVLESEGFGLR